jgi:hypothetical protein
MSGESEKSLKELCVQHGTDKAWHRYPEIYDEIFRTRRLSVKKVLEIGVLGGASMRMWRDYFINAIIYGIDSNAECLNQSSDRIVCFQAQQAERAQLQAFINQCGTGFDIVVDDGSHFYVDQQVSFGFLFPHLVSKGWYVIEDIYTSWWADHLKSPHMPTWDWLQVWFKKGLLPQGAMMADEVSYVQQHLDRVMLYGNTLSTIAAMTKQ